VGKGPLTNNWPVGWDEVRLKKNSDPRTLQSEPNTPVFEFFFQTDKPGICTGSERDPEPIPMPITGRRGVVRFNGLEKKPDPCLGIQNTGLHEYWFQIGEK